MKHAEATSKPKKAQHKEKRSSSPRPDAASDNGVSPNRKKKRDQLAVEVNSELRELRSNLDAMLEHYRLRLGGQIADLQQALAGSALEPRTKPPSAKTTNAIVKALREAEFKPNKGRGKDFVKLQRLVRKLGEMLPPES